jgi:hypothetical protein
VSPTLDPSPESFADIAPTSSCSPLRHSRCRVQTQHVATCLTRTGERYREQEDQVNTMMTPDRGRSK